MNFFFNNNDIQHINLHILQQMDFYNSVYCRKKSQITKKIRQNPQYKHISGLLVI